MNRNESTAYFEGFDPGLAYSTYRIRRFAFILAGITAFFASLSFMVTAYAGSSLFDKWTGQQLFYGMIGAGIVATVTLFQLTLYSSSELKRSKWIVFALVMVAVSFAIITETGGGMMREDARVENRSNQSVSMRNLQKAIDQMSENLSTNPYQQSLEKAYQSQSSAEYELGRCDRHLSTGQWRVNQCIEYETRIIERNKQLIVRLINQSEAAKHSTLETMSTLLQKAKTHEYDDAFHIGIIRAIKTMFGISFDVASFTLFLTTVCIFEIALHYLGRRYAESRDLLLYHGYDLVRFFRARPRLLTETSYQQIGNKAETKKELSVNSQPVKPNEVPTLNRDHASSTVHADEENLYSIIKDLILSRELAPNIRALKAAMKKGGYFSDDLIRQERAELILDTLHCDTHQGLRILLPNPEYSKTGIKRPKYVLNAALTENITKGGQGSAA